MGGCLTLLQSWELYRMPFLASVSHQLWSVRPGIGRSHTVLIYRLMIEQYAREGLQNAIYNLRTGDCSPPYMKRPRGSYPTAPIEPEPDPEQAHSHEDSNCYHTYTGLISLDPTRSSTTLSTKSQCPLNPDDSYVNPHVKTRVPHL
ncbi:hypothetical protein GOBAR_DD09893 [Gossypium barbadense]|nr:hypothetical protein GOBAR_DD09893 [Gossypium barbadense]